DVEGDRAGAFEALKARTVLEKRIGIEIRQRQPDPLRRDLAAGIDIERRRAGASIKLEARQRCRKLAAGDRGLKRGVADLDVVVDELGRGELEFGGDGLES